MSVRTYLALALHLDRQSYDTLRSYFGKVLHLLQCFHHARNLIVPLLEFQDQEQGKQHMPLGPQLLPALTQIEEAKKVCQRCIVKEPCLAWALESGQDAGVWGGLSEDERRALKRRAARNRARLMEQQNQI